VWDSDRLLFCEFALSFVLGVLFELWIRTGQVEFEFEFEFEFGTCFGRYDPRMACGSHPAPEIDERPEWGAQIVERTFE